jgi:YidC/Oxa1 family membrane protein insertase
MDNLRFVLVVVLSMIVVMLWQAWQKDYGPKPEKVAQEAPVDINTAEEMPVEVLTENKDVAVDTNSEFSETTSTDSSVPRAEVYASQIISVKTDVLSLEIDTNGGTLRNLDLLKYPVEIDKPDEYVRLFNSSEEKLYLAQSGLIAASRSSVLPNHHSVLTSENDIYELNEDQNILRVPLTWTNNQGMQVTKTYIFTRGSYLINVEQKISNNSAQVWTGRQYSQLLRKPYADKKKNTFIRTFTGGVIYNEEDKYKRISFDDMQDENLSVKALGGWDAMIQHYFAAAWIPPNDEENNFYTKALPEERYVIGSYSPLVSVQPSTERVLTSNLFVGPKLQPVMEKIAPGLELTVDYGWLTFIGKPIFWLLNKIHTLVGNWGFAIMGVTLCIKLLFFKLSEVSYKSMAKMRKVQPMLKELKEQYADDKQTFNTKMMEMYKKEKVNPMGGCFPILVQIPVFISLYWVLIETVELRQAPFILWIHDLSVQDPYFVLPVLMGITMKIQQSLNPPPIDPVQAKVMKMFPFVFTVFFLFFPSGLVLYWVVNNTLSIIQQWYITKKIEAAG